MSLETLKQALGPHQPQGPWSNSPLQAEEPLVKYHKWLHLVLSCYSDLQANTPDLIAFCPSEKYNHLNLLGGEFIIDFTGNKIKFIYRNKYFYNVFLSQTEMSSQLCLCHS